MAVILPFVAESCLDQVLTGITFGQGCPGQGIGLIGTITQVELFQYVIAETALAEIGQTYGASLIGVEQCILKEIQCKLVGDEHGLALVLNSLFRFGEFTLVVWYAVFAGQPFGGIPV